VLISQELTGVAARESMTEINLEKDRFSDMEWGLTFSPHAQKVDIKQAGQNFIRNKIIPPRDIKSKDHQEWKRSCLVFDAFLLAALNKAAMPMTRVSHLTLTLTLTLNLK